MKSNVELLENLPPNLRVMDCSYCGRLMAADAWEAKRFRASGLRALGGFILASCRRVDFRHYRPVCFECFVDLPSVHHEEFHGRATHQVVKMKRKLVHDECVGQTSNEQAS